MHIRNSISAGLLSLTLLGAGCSAAPTPSPLPTDTENPKPAPVTSQEPSIPPASEPAPTPTPTPTPKPAATKPAPKPFVKTHTVEIKDGAYSPQIVAVNAGDTIVWKNIGTSNHTVHSAGASVLWDSGNLVPGATYRYTFPAAGRYEYYCASHPSMKGTVIVGEIRPQ